MSILRKRKNYIFLLSSQTDTILGATYYLKDGHYHLGRVEDVRTPIDFRCGKCRVVLHSSMANIFQDRFPKAKPEILSMMLDDRIREEGFLSADASLSHTYTVLGSEGKMQQLLVVSMPSQLVEMAFELAEETDVRRLASVTSVTTAIAALIGRISTDPVMAVFVRNNSCEYLVCHRGLPLMMQTSPVEEDSPDVSKMVLMGMKALAQRAYRGVKIRVEKVLFLGHGVDYSAVVQEGFKVLKPDFSKFVSAENAADLVRYPEFAGALVVGKRLDYVPGSWRFAYNFQNVACYAGIAAGVAALIMAGVNLSLNKEVESYRSQYGKLYERVSEDSLQVLGMLPDKKETAGLERLMGFWRQNLKEPRMDDLLLKIAQALPPDTRIEYFKADRKSTGVSEPSSSAPVPSPSVIPPADQPVSPASMQAEPGSDISSLVKPVSFEMKLVTQGDFANVRTRFENAVENLRKWFVITDINWHYAEAASEGAMECRFESREAGERS